MRILIFVLFLVVISLKITSICSGSCFQECDKSIPERVRLWKKKDYGLEIPGKIELDTKLKGLDDSTQKQAKDGRLITMYQVDKLIRANNKGDQANNPDFKIVKLDPISYEYENTPMLITFSNVKLTNLDAYSYDEESAQYSQTGVYEKGEQEIDPQVYQKIEKQKRDKGVKPLYDRISQRHSDGKYILSRRDCKWTIKIGARFITHQTKGDKPIIIETDFKIQPDKTINEQQIETDEKPLRAKGVIKMEFHDFQFNLSLDITHIDDPLRPFLDAMKRSDNLAPDFDIEYSMEAIEIKEIKLQVYDKDDNFPVKTDTQEDVNQNLPSKEDLMKNTTANTNPVEVEKTFITNEVLKKKVLKHFDVLKKLIQKNPTKIKKKLCGNLLPKMAWKIMHMETKKQLPSLFYQIIAYEDGFHEKSLLPKFTAQDWANLMKDYVIAKAKNFGKNFGGFWRSNSAPAALPRTEKESK